MMKSWADHCSSDEESISDDIEEEIEEQNVDVPKPTSPDEQPPLQQDDPPHEEEAVPARVYDYPTQPPFTAFVGNLAFSVKDPDDLKSAIVDVASQLLGVQLNVLGARVALDRKDAKPRGFGYVEVETLDEVSALCFCCIDTGV